MNKSTKEPKKKQAYKKLKKVMQLKTRKTTLSIVPAQTAHVNANEHIQKKRVHSRSRHWCTSMVNVYRYKNLLQIEFMKKP